MTPDDTSRNPEETMEVVAGLRPDGIPITFSIPLAVSDTPPPYPVSSIEPDRSE